MHFVIPPYISSGKWIKTHTENFWFLEAIAFILDLFKQKLSLLSI